MENLAKVHGINRVKKNKFILTFPQTTGKITFEDVYNYVEIACDNVIVCKEFHKDGGEHIHVACSFNKKISKDVLLKLLQKTFPLNQNVNIQVAKCFHCCWEYCKKDGVYLEKGESGPCLKERLLKKKAMSEEEVVKIVTDWFEESVLNELKLEFEKFKNKTRKAVFEYYNI